MGQKVNPIAVRLNFNRFSDSSWFSDYYYSTLIYQDFNFRQYFHHLRRPNTNKLGFRSAKCIIHHFPKRSLIHLFCLSDVRKKTNICLQQFRRVSMSFYKSSLPAVGPGYPVHAGSFGPDVAERGKPSVKDRPKPPRGYPVEAPIGRRFESYQDSRELETNKLSKRLISVDTVTSNGFLGDTKTKDTQDRAPVSPVTIRKDTSGMLDTASASVGRRSQRLGSTSYWLNSSISHKKRALVHLHRLMSDERNTVTSPYLNPIKSAETHKIKRGAKLSIHIEDQKPVTRVIRAPWGSFVSPHASIVNQLWMVSNPHQKVILPETAIISTRYFNFYAIHYLFMQQIADSLGRLPHRSFNAASQRLVALEANAQYPKLTGGVEPAGHGSTRIHSGESGSPTNEVRQHSLDVRPEVHPFGGEPVYLRTLPEAEIPTIDARSDEVASERASDRSNDRSVATVSVGSLPSEKANVNHIVSSERARHHDSIPHEESGLPPSGGPPATNGRLMHGIPQHKNQIITTKNRSTTGRSVYGSLVGSGGRVNQWSYFFGSVGSNKVTKSLDFYLSNVHYILSKNTNTFLSIRPIKVHSVFQCASLVAQEVACKLEQKKSFRLICRLIFQQLATCDYIKGIRITCSGRLNGAEIAKTECRKFGETSLHVFSDKIDYAQTKASTPYGILGVKVWISYI